MIKENVPLKVFCFLSIENELDQLILSFFGDSHIKLDCKMSECMHISQIPSDDSDDVSYIGFMRIFSLLGVMVIISAIATSIFHFKFSIIFNVQRR